MSLSEFANFSDIIATVAIVLTLIFVGLELRLTRKQSELSNWRDVLQQLTDYKGITNDLTFAQMVVKGHEDYEALSAAEKLSFGLYLEQAVHIYGNFQKHNDSLPRKLVGLETALQNMFVEMLTTPGGKMWWQESRARGRFMPDTYRIVDDFLKRDVT